MLGRGSTDDKGPVLGWLNAIEAHQKAGVDFPVNLLMCFEGMEEYGSEGLDELIEAEAKKWFADADAVCISGQLLARHREALPCLRPPWLQLLQRRDLGTRRGSPQRRVRRYRPGAHDGSGARPGQPR